MAKNAVITGWGFYAPSRVVTNFDLAKFVDTTDEWISSRTGIKERRFASDGENTSSMSVRAARMALDRAKLRPQDVQMVIVGTCSPDYLFPATACIVQSEIGATRAGAFDVEAACTSFVTALGHDSLAWTDGSGFPGQAFFKQHIVNGVLSAMGNVAFCT